MISQNAQPCSCMLNKEHLVEIINMINIIYEFFKSFQMLTGFMLGENPPSTYARTVFLSSASSQRSN